MNIKTNSANKSNYGAQRAVSKIKYIVIHFTANDGDTDENNGKYFKNNVVKASAHYFVDSDSVTQSVPDNYVAWSVGGNKYSDCAKTGGGKYYGTVTNTNSLSIELCDDVKNGVIYPSKKTIENAVELTKSLMKKYNVPQKNVIRHFDVTGKLCPAYWCGTSEKDKMWKSEFWDKLGANDIEAAIDKLVSAGIINTAEYWMAHYKDLAYIDELLCKMAANVDKRTKKEYALESLSEALDKMVRAGIINTPEYWEKNCGKVLYLDVLIFRFTERL